MKRTLFVAFTLATVCAQASFDLMLLPGNDNRIYRYDPVHNVHLGSYATNGNSNLVAADNRGISYSSTNTTSIHAVNYSSGEQVNMLTGTAGARAQELVGSYVYALTGNSLRRTHITTSASTVYNTAAFDMQSMAGYGNNLVIVGLNTSNQISLTNFNLTTLTFGSTLTMTFSVGSGTVLGKAAINASPATGAVSLVYAYSTGASAVAVRMPLTAAGVATTISHSSQTLSQFGVATQMPSFMAGHGGGFWAFGRDSVSVTNSRVTRLELSATSTPIEGDSATFAAFGGAFPAVQTYTHAANVVAPEPSTMIALGLGIAAILRRRKSKSKL